MGRKYGAASRGRSVPNDIVELLVRPAVDLTRDELLEVAADAFLRSSSEIAGRRDHIEAICRLLVERVEHELRDALTESGSTHGITVRHAAPSSIHP